MAQFAFDHWDCILSIISVNRPFEDKHRILQNFPNIISLLARSDILQDRLFHYG